MQQLSWDDLRFLLATIRGGSFSAAARTLKVDATTVARRIERLAEAAGGAVLERDGGGGVVPSARGQLLLRRAEAMERQAEMIADDLGRDAGEILGEVRVTSVPLIVNRLLVPALGALLARHPKLSVELVPESRDVDLLRREADIALRLARPSRGGLRVKAAQIGELSYAVYAPREAAASALRISPNGSYAVFFISTHVASSIVQLRFVDLETGKVVDSPQFRSQNVTFDGRPQLFWDAEGQGVFCHVSTHARSKWPYELTHYKFADGKGEVVAPSRNIGASSTLGEGRIALWHPEAGGCSVLDLATLKLFRLPEHNYIIGGRGNRAVIADLERDAIYCATVDLADE